MAKRIAITGASGYIGRRLLAALEPRPQVETLLAIDIKPLETAGPKVRFLKLDVTQPLEREFCGHGVDTVVPLAFILKPGHHREAIRRVNVDGMRNVLQAAAAAGVRQVLYLSSTTIYGPHPDHSLPLTEEAPPRPLKGFPYSEDKAEVERLLEAFAREHPEAVVTVLRSCVVLGPQSLNFITQAFRKPLLVAIRGYDPPLQFVHEDDLVALMIHMLERPVPGVFNVAGEGTIPYSEMARLLGRRLLKLPAWLLYPLTQVSWLLRLQGDSPACGLHLIRYPWVVSTEKLKRETGFRFRYSSREALLSFCSRLRQDPSPLQKS